MKMFLFSNLTAAGEAKGQLVENGIEKNSTLVEPEVIFITHSLVTWSLHFFALFEVHVFVAEATRRKTVLRNLECA